MLRFGVDGVVFRLRASGLVSGSFMGFMDGFKQFAGRIRRGVSGLRVEALGCTALVFHWCFWVLPSSGLV